MNLHEQNMPRVLFCLAAFAEHQVRDHRCCRGCWSALPCCTVFHHRRNHRLLIGVDIAVLLGWGYSRQAAVNILVLCAGSHASLIPRHTLLLLLFLKWEHVLELVAYDHLIGSTFSFLVSFLVVL